MLLEQWLGFWGLEQGPVEVRPAPPPLHRGRMGGIANQWYFPICGLRQMGIQPGWAYLTSSRE